jgi:pSer/pThr/pTyr-binding forkhead associated (FHA) protein
MSTTLRLTVLTGPHKDASYCLCAPMQCIIGRAEDCPIKLSGAAKDRLISRHHCQLVYAPPYLGIRDLGSRNGTYLNGKKVDAPLVALVKPENDIEGEVISQGDLLAVGGTTFKIEIAECPPLWTGLRQVES